MFCTAPLPKLLTFLTLLGGGPKLKWIYGIRADGMDVTVMSTKPLKVPRILGLVQVSLGHLGLIKK